MLDEVHFLEDRYRGSVWEEIILSAPAHVALVCLSATVSNAEELAAWIDRCRGEVGAVSRTGARSSSANLYVVGDARRAPARLPDLRRRRRRTAEAAALDERGAASHATGGADRRRRHE